MSTAIATSIAQRPGQQHPDRHKTLLTRCSLAAALCLATLMVIGLPYYLTSLSNRPYHPMHEVLRPGGTIGLSLGIFGTFLFVLIFLYALRKRWPWLSQIGESRHWLDFHILMGFLAPVVIAFHASFKFGGLAGVAYWIMVAVAGSGFVGRYVYMQIPRRRNSTVLSLQEAKGFEETLMARLAGQKLVSTADLTNLLRLPTARQVEQGSVLAALGGLIWLDLCRPFKVACVRRQALGGEDTLATLGGLLRSGNRELERIIEVAKDQARLSKKLLFFSKSQRILCLWHIVHRPLSYSFAVLALMHVAIAMLFGVR